MKLHTEWLWIKRNVFLRVYDKIDKAGLGTLGTRVGSRKVCMCNISGKKQWQQQSVCLEGYLRAVFKDRK